jgi:hypothetical protein
MAFWKEAARAETPFFTPPGADHLIAVTRNAQCGTKYEIYAHPVFVNTTN